LSPEIAGTIPKEKIRLTSIRVTVLHDLLRKQLNQIKMNRWQIKRLIRTYESDLLLFDKQIDAIEGYFKRHTKPVHVVSNNEKRSKTNKS
jgi:hypothetical protein